MPRAKRREFPGASGEKAFLIAAKRQGKKQSSPSLRHIVVFPGTRPAERAAFNDQLAFEIYAFAALRANHPRTLEARQILGLNLDFDPAFIEKHIIGKLRIGLLLAGIFAIAGIYEGTKESMEDSVAAELIPKEQHGMAFGTWRR